MNLNELITKLEFLVQVNIYNDHEEALSYLRQLQKIREIAQDASGYVEFYERTMEVLKDVY